MAWQVVMKCDNCEARCPVIPIPLDILAKWAADENKTIQERSFDLYMGKSALGICQKKKLMILINFMGEMK